MSETADILIIGAGMAGASAAAHLAGSARVVLLEGENQPGYHATGRSAAMFTETYGNPTVRALTRASRRFLEAPPDGFAAHPLLSPRGVMMVATTALEGTLAAQFAAMRALCPDLAWLDPAEARRRVSVLREGAITAAFLEPGAMELDVHALHAGYLRSAREAGCRLLTDMRVCALTRQAGAWRAETTTGAFSAPIVINAAGAWVESVAALAGLAPLGIVAKRRTAMTIAPPPEASLATWPLVFVVDESLYFKPDGGRLLLSPADETPTPPTDAQPEEIDIAMAIDRLQAITTIAVSRVERKWAGLRSFAADKTPVAGFDPAADGFFWLAGQGGYGIQTADALGRVTAALIGGGALPPDIAALGVAAADLAPARLRR